MKKILRFAGDPTGYMIVWDSSDRPHGWLWAHVGVTSKRVLVDADKAYLIGDVREGAPA